MRVDFAGDVGIAVPEDLLHLPERPLLNRDFAVVDGSRLLRAKADSSVRCGEFRTEPAHDGNRGSAGTTGNAAGSLAISATTQGPCMTVLRCTCLDES
jgi:hypothetical protein